MTAKIVGVSAILLAVSSLALSFDSLGVLVALLAVFVASISALLKNINHSIIAALIATVAIFGVSPLPQILKQTESVGTSIETSSYNQELVPPPMAGESTEIYIQKRMGDQQEIAERNKIFLAVIGGVYFLYIATIGYAIHKS
jgi:hypothetical protein